MKGAFVIFPCLLLLSALVEVSGSGSMYDPPNRGVMWKYGFPTQKNYDYMQLNCGGEKQLETGPPKCGVCGDPYSQARDHEKGGKYGSAIISRYFPAGIKEIPVKVELLAFEKGFFEFRICPVNNGTVTQECLDENQLPIKEGYLKGTPMQFYPKEAGDFRLTIAIPPNITCDRCVLQWRYHTANSWGTDPITGTEGLGEGPQEDFYNCADIQIGGNIPKSLLRNKYFAPIDQSTFATAQENMPTVHQQSMNNRIRTLKPTIVDHIRPEVRPLQPESVDLSAHDASSSDHWAINSVQQGQTIPSVGTPRPGGQFVATSDITNFGHVPDASHLNMNMDFSANDAVAHVSGLFGSGEKVAAEGRTAVGNNIMAVMTGKEKIKEDKKVMISNAINADLGSFDISNNLVGGLNVPDNILQKTRQIITQDLAGGDGHASGVIRTDWSVNSLERGVLLDADKRNDVSRDSGMVVIPGTQTNAGGIFVSGVGEAKDDKSHSDWTAQVKSDSNNQLKASLVVSVPKKIPFLIPPINTVENSKGNGKADTVGGHIDMAIGQSGIVRGHSGGVSGKSGMRSDQSGVISDQSSIMSGHIVRDHTGMVSSEFGEKSGHSSVVSSHSGVAGARSAGISGHSGAVGGQSGGVGGHSSVVGGQSATMSGHADMTSGHTGMVSGESGGMIDHSRIVSSHSGMAGGRSGGVSGHSSVISGHSGMVGGQSGGMSGHSRSVSDESGGMSSHSSAVSGQSGGEGANSSIVRGQSATIGGQTGMSIGHTGMVSGESGGMSDHLSVVSSHSGMAGGRSGGVSGLFSAISGHSGVANGQSGGMSGHSRAISGQSGGMRGHSSMVSDESGGKISHSSAVSGQSGGVGGHSSVVGVQSATISGQASMGGVHTGMVSGESGGMSDQSSAMSSHSSAVRGQSGTVSGQSGDVSGHSSVMSGQPGVVGGHSGAVRGQSGTVSGQSGDVSGHSSVMSGHSGAVSSHSSMISGHSGMAGGQSGGASGHSIAVSGQSGGVSSHSRVVSDQSGTVSGHSGMIGGHTDILSGHSGVSDGQPGESSGHSSMVSGQSGTVSGHTGKKIGQTGMVSGHSSESGGQSGMISGQFGVAGGQSGLSGGQSGAMRGHSIERSGQSSNLGVGSSKNDSVSVEDVRRGAVIASVSASVVSESTSTNIAPKEQHILQTDTLSSSDPIVIHAPKQSVKMGEMPIISFTPAVDTDVTVKAGEKTPLVSGEAKPVEGNSVFMKAGTQPNVRFSRIQTSSQGQGAVVMDTKGISAQMMTDAASSQPSLQSMLNEVNLIVSGVQDQSAAASQVPEYIIPDVQPVVNANMDTHGHAHNFPSEGHRTTFIDLASSDGSQTRNEVVQDTLIDLRNGGTVSRVTDEQDLHPNEPHSHHGHMHHPIVKNQEENKEEITVQIRTLEETRRIEDARRRQSLHRSPGDENIQRELGSFNVDAIPSSSVLDTGISFGSDGVLRPGFGQRPEGSVDNTRLLNRERNSMIPMGIIPGDNFEVVTDPRTGSQQRVRQTQTGSGGSSSGRSSSSRTFVVTTNRRGQVHSGSGGAARNVDGRISEGGNGVARGGSANGGGGMRGMDTVTMHNVTITRGGGSQRPTGAVGGTSARTAGMFVSTGGDTRRMPGMPGMRMFPGGTNPIGPMMTGRSFGPGGLRPGMFPGGMMGHRMAGFRPGDAGGVGAGGSAGVATGTGTGGARRGGTATGSREAGSRTAGGSGGMVAGAGGGMAGGAGGSGRGGGMTRGAGGMVAGAGGGMAGGAGGSGAGGGMTRGAGGMSGRAMTVHMGGMTGMTGGMPGGGRPGSMVGGMPGGGMAGGMPGGGMAGGMAGGMPGGGMAGGGMPGGMAGGMPGGGMLITGMGGFPGMGGGPMAGPFGFGTFGPGVGRFPGMGGFPMPGM